MDYDSFYHPGIKESQKIMPLLLHGRAVCAQIPQIAQENEAVRRQNEKYEACDKSLKELRQIKTQMLRDSSDAIDTLRQYLAQLAEKKATLDRHKEQEQGIRRHQGLLSDMITQIQIEKRGF